MFYGLYSRTRLNNMSTRMRPAQHAANLLAFCCHGPDRRTDRGGTTITTEILISPLEKPGLLFCWHSPNSIQKKTTDRSQTQCELAKGQHSV